MALPVRQKNTDITRWDPFRDLAELDARMNRIFESAMGTRRSAMWTPPVDVEETDTSYVVEAELPGVQKDDISIELTNNVLSIHGEAKGGTQLNFGSYGLKALEPERITARQIEAARRALTRQMKRQGRVWIRIFPDVPVSKKPAEVRMGSGKGSPEFWVARVKPGRIMFELDGVSGEIAREALALAAAKLPIRTKVVARIGLEA